MVEVACELNGKCDVDQRSFKAYLSRWMGYTAIVAPFTRDTIYPLLQKSAQAAAAQCIHGTVNGPDPVGCNIRWSPRPDLDAQFGIEPDVGQQMAGMEVIQNLLLTSVAGPVTESTGGLSKSDPEAGANAPKSPIVFGSVTTGDKAGASILTMVVVVSILVGAWWMVK